MTLEPEERDRLVRVEANLADQHADIHEIKSDVKALDAKVDTLVNAWNNRPPWFVALAIGTLMSAVSGLAVIVITQG